MSKIFYKTTNWQAETPVSNEHVNEVVHLKSAKYFIKMGSKAYNGKSYADLPTEVNKYFHMHLKLIDEHKKNNSNLC